MLAFIAGCGCMLAALVLINITVARGGYRPVLLRALSFAAAADACFVIAAWRGRRLWVLAAVLASLPTWWVVADFIERS